MYKLSNNSIYGNEKSLFVSSGDHNLIEISGDSVPFVNEVINGFKEEKTIDELYNQIKNYFDNDRTYFDEVCGWLIANKIIYQKDSDNLEISILKTYLSCVRGKSAGIFFEYISNRVEKSSFKFILENDLSRADLVIVVAPLFENLEEVLRINKFTFENNIPLCHVGIESSRTITLGPLTYSGLRTPCLNCYIKRKITNLKSPHKTISFIEHSNKNVIKTSTEVNSSWIKVAAINLREELEIFFGSKKRISALLGKSLIFDYNDYSITKSRLLRTPLCDVCNNLDRYSPFNI